jgi:hypothetical protein
MSCLGTNLQKTLATAGLLAALLLAVDQSSVRAQSTAAPGATPTFSKDVAPLLQRSCQRCHRPGSIGPMPLLTYEDARPWARAIRSQVVNRIMPPWHIDRTVGIQKFLDDPSLTEAEISTIARWVDGGAPRGNPADMPPPIAWTPADRWGIGEPDLIVTLKSGDLMVAAAAADQWLNLDLEDSGFTEDRYIKAIEIKATKGVPNVHHANASYEIEAPDGTVTSAHLVEYAVGKAGEIYPDGSGKLLKAGSRLRMNLHLHSTGEATPANVALGLKFYPKGQVPKFVHLTRHVGDQEEGIDIPAGEANARSEGFTVLQQATRLAAFQPHMHNRGKRQCLEAIYPPSGGGASAGGRADLARVETLSCANFHFAWHLQYHYAVDAQPLLPKGTILRVVSWHDNSAANKYNPDPTNWVGFGQRTIDDMAFAWVTVHYMTDDDYTKAVQERAEKNKAAATQQQP